MRVRKAIESDFDEVFMMGFDVWSNNQSKEDHLSRCHFSPKYKKGQWWVLEGSNKSLLSSLITYELSLGYGMWGIGSIATLGGLRGNGYASKLLQVVGDDVFTNQEGDAIFLFSDIDPDFYKRRGYMSLPDEFQKPKGSICMVRAERPDRIWSAKGFSPPDYF